MRSSNTIMAAAVAVTLLLTSGASAQSNGHVQTSQPQDATVDPHAPTGSDEITGCACCRSPSRPADAVSYESVPAKVLDALMVGSPAGFAGEPLTFPLPGGQTAHGEIIGGFDYPLGGWYAWGVLDDAEAGFFAIASKDGSLFASLHYGDMFYALRKPSRITTSHGGYAVEFSTTKTGQAELLRHATRRVLTEQAPFASANTIIDHLYVYSNDFEYYMGDFDGDGTAGTRADGVARVMVSIAELNTVYLNSAINITARLAYAYAGNVDRSVVPTMGQLNGVSDGIVDEIHLVRDLVQADLGSYKRAVPTGSGSGGSAQAYSQSPTSWLNKGTLGPAVDGGGNGHEIGHSMGMAHARGDSSLTPHPSIPFAYSHCLTAAMKATMMGGPCPASSGPVLRQYSNPDLTHPVTGEPLGIDHDIDPLNSADGARAHNETALIVTAFRTGAAQYPDCDGDEILDIIEIYQGTAQDCNGNGIDDACDIASGNETDCDSNGVPDSCELGALSVAETRSRVFWIETTGETFDFTGIPTIESALTITVSTPAAFDAVTSIDVYVDSQLAGSIFVNDPITAPCDTRSATLVYAAHGGSVAQVELVVNGGRLHLSGSGCSAKIDVTLDYLVTAAGDVNRNGVYDACEPGCSPFDIEAPFGTIDVFDLTLWTNWYSAGDLRADYAAPYGELDALDYAAFFEGYLAGCP